VKIPDRYGLPMQAVVRRRFDAAAGTFDGAAVLHTEARSRMLERLALFRLEPKSVLDVGAATGAGSAALVALYPEAHVIAVDASLPMAWQAAKKAPEAAVFAGDAHELPVEDHSVDLVFANLLLPWVDPQVVLREFARVLRRDGLVMFTSFGPDTLLELRRAWSTVDEQIHVHGFIDLHDLGDLTARAGLSEPVMDVDRLQIRYSSLTDLIADLRGTGAVNSAAGRSTGLTGRGRWQAFENALLAGASPFAVTVELVFGQAWSTGGQAGPIPADGVARIAAEDLAKTAKKGRSDDA